GSKLHDYRISLFLCSEVSHFVLESKTIQEGLLTLGDFTRKFSSVFMAQYSTLVVSRYRPLLRCYAMIEV
ncbi:hypothetical protein, partial [Vibrio profundi]|uniref:hypothetical protein n=1 Tax=Vibrio profundi TaxID=1774960 RepID=UPI003736F6BB